MRREFNWTNVLVSASIATAATTALVAFLGKKEAGSAAAPLNATSHIAWGEEAADIDRMDLKHTGVGTLLNAGAMLMWSLVQEFLLQKWFKQDDLKSEIAAGVATSVLAYVTDYHVVPERLTPGFEKRLSKTSLATVYLALAGSLVAGLVLSKRAE